MASPTPRPFSSPVAPDSLPRERLRRVIGSGNGDHCADCGNADGVDEAIQVQVLFARREPVQTEADAGDERTRRIDRSPAEAVGQGADKADQAEGDDLLHGDQKPRHPALLLQRNTDDLVQHIGLRETEKAHDRHDDQADVQVGVRIQAGDAPRKFDGAEAEIASRCGRGRLAQFGNPFAMLARPGPVPPCFVVPLHTLGVRCTPPVKVQLRTLAGPAFPVNLGAGQPVSVRQLAGGLWRPATGSGTVALACVAPSPSLA